jgi:hypothetical protein
LGVINSKMNNKIISSNIEEALEELEKIKNELEIKTLSEVNFQIKLHHVYHHLNMAWNVRNAKTEQYRNMTDDDFKKWSSYPKDDEFDEE